MGAELMEDGFLMRFMNIVDSFTHFNLGAVAFTLFSISAGIGVSTNTVANTLVQHMVLTVLGYVVLFAQSLLVLSPNNGWSRSYSDKEKNIVHGVMHFIGCVLALAGGGVAMAGVSLQYNSTHGKMGIAVMVFTGLSLIVGLVHHFTSCMPRVMHACHMGLACLTIIFAFVTMTLGIDTVYRGLLNDRMTDLLIAFSVIALVGTILPSCVRVLKRLIN
ncbi:uncharacterized protein LOC114359655 [Ostrinia furnacalis]|uniref:uncharacterized protein LOC114359655 n=1 Tax=Ostrinia furnacalis TaxID=93504 RepID=UPI00103FD064|nr:uncharacterized protein LOC114359655 [Ostrinia furnacalis]